MELEYVIAWSVYVAAGLGCLLVFMRITNKLPSIARKLLIGLFVVIVFTPWFIGQEFDQISPAILVYVMDLFFDDTQMGKGAGSALMLSSVVMLLILLFVEMLQRRRRKRNKNLFI